MPEFLDSDCIKFLLEEAKLDIKRHEIHVVLKEMNNKLKKNRIQIAIKHKINDALSKNPLPGASNKLQLFLQSSIQKQIETKKALMKKTKS